MRKKLWTSAALLVLLSILGASYTKSAAAQDARDPFVVTVTTNAVTNFNYTPVTIPTGKRLVIEYVSLSGAAQSIVNNQVEPIQPITILNTTVAGGPANLFYLAPPQNNQLSTQFYLAQPVTIYADTLAVGPAFAGFTPTFDTFNVVISGYLVDIPKTPTPPTT
jgi:hypothetical protein